MMTKIDINKLKEKIEEAKKLEEALRELGVIKGKGRDVPLLLLIFSEISHVRDNVSTLSDKISYLLGMTAVSIGLLIVIAVKVFGL